MGPYCDYCGRRCFVTRLLPFKTGTLLMATCVAGAAHDRKMTGYDHTTAINPSQVDWEQPFTDRDLIERVSHLQQSDLAGLMRNRDRARAVAVALEQEQARLAAQVERTLAYLRTFDCECDNGEDEELVFEREITPCDRCIEIGNLEVAMWPVAGLDRLLDVVNDPALEAAL